MGKSKDRFYAGAALRGNDPLADFVKEVTNEHPLLLKSDVVRQALQEYKDRYKGNAEEAAMKILSISKAA